MKPSEAVIQRDWLDFTLNVRQNLHSHPPHGMNKWLTTKQSEFETELGPVFVGCCCGFNLHSI